MSPFTKCFDGRNLIMASVIGGNLNIIQYLLSFKYKIKSGNSKTQFKLNNFLLFQDNRGNTAMHYAYAHNYPEIRDLLRKYESTK